MKKSTKTLKESPAPATATAVAPAPAPKPSRVPKIKKAAEAAFNGFSGAANGGSAASATVITAKIDIGFGNRLFIRGEGPGLSWEKGTALECVADDRWVISLPKGAEAVAFKFLINDETWNIGDDYVVPAGTSFSVTPLF